MKGNSQWLQKNAFYTRNTREEKLSTLFGLSQGTDMDMYDFEFSELGELIKIIPLTENWM